ncbi:MAG TPA: HD domain-containing phosphohydrolase [Gemmatimonadaceae bacterium]|nr:HD domain-containing phosphohydrolase [Gemmatimonadaceae bacterium]
MRECNRAVERDALPARRLLAIPLAMREIVPISVGVASTALGAREHTLRVRAERLSAATMETLLNAIDANDAVTGAHVRRVAAYALILGEAAGFDERELHSIERVALFHDIGKLHGALTDIFHESSKLTPEERRAVKTHPLRGAEVLSPLTAFYPALAKSVAAHHERWDGTGYPRGLKGRRIPREARVVAIADTFDAITHQRRYSQARSFSVAVKAIEDGKGTQFDPDLVDLFLRPDVLSKIEKEMRRSHSPRGKGSNRRRGEKTPGPDINFRWRPRSRGSRSRDRQS